MNIFEGVKFNNSFAKLSEEFYTKQKWSSFEKAHLISFNKGLAKELGFNPELKPEETAVEFYLAKLNPLKDCEICILKELAKLLIQDLPMAEPS